MSLQDDVKTILVASTTLATAFTGGIKMEDEMGGMGLNRTLNPSAYESTSQKLKPTLIIRERQQVPTSTIADEDLQIRSFVQPVEIALYNDRINGYATLESAQDTIYTLLQNRKAGNLTLIWRTNTRANRDRNHDNACILTCVYDGYGVKS